MGLLKDHLLQEQNSDAHAKAITGIVIAFFVVRLAAHVSNG